MGHYDSAYEAEAEEAAQQATKLAKKQLKLMENFQDTLVSNLGARGISKRHLEALQDMINETELRAK